MQLLKNRGWGAKGQKFRKRSVGEVQKTLILERGALLWGINFSKGGSENFVGKKIHNYSIKNSLSSTLRN